MCQCLIHLQEVKQALKSGQRAIEGFKTLLNKERKGGEMEKKNREELVSLLKALHRGALSPRETYRAIQAFGEMNFQEARSEVEGFLGSKDPELRFVSLKVLTRY
jgi:hypothetical protein